MKTHSTEPKFFSAQISSARRFYLDLNSSAIGPLTVISGGSEQCRPDYRMQRSGFRYYSVEFVAAGAGSLMLKGKKYTLSAGDIFAYGPRIAHDIQSDADRPLVKYFVDLSAENRGTCCKTQRPSRVNWSKRQIHRTFAGFLKN